MESKQSARVAISRIAHALGLKRRPSLVGGSMSRYAPSAENAGHQQRASECQSIAWAGRGPRGLRVLGSAILWLSTQACVATQGSGDPPEIDTHELRALWVPIAEARVSGNKVAVPFLYKGQRFVRSEEELSSWMGGAMIEDSNCLIVPFPREEVDLEPSHTFIPYSPWWIDAASNCLGDLRHRQGHMIYLWVPMSPGSMIEESVTRLDQAISRLRPDGLIFELDLSAPNEEQNMPGYDLHDLRGAIQPFADSLCAVQPGATIGICPLYPDRKAARSESASMPAGWDRFWEQIRSCFELGCLDYVVIDESRLDLVVSAWSKSGDRRVNPREPGPRSVLLLRSGRQSKMLDGHMIPSPKVRGAVIGEITVLFGESGAAPAVRGGLPPQWRRCLPPKVGTRGIEGHLPPSLLAVQEDADGLMLLLNGSARARWFDIRLRVGCEWMSEPLISAYRNVVRVRGNGPTQGGPKRIAVRSVDTRGEHSAWTYWPK